MRKLLKKELLLSASPLAFCFISFGLMFFLPGYPVLCGAFFVTLGLYQSFLHAREANDTLFSALLPVAKQDTVKSRFLFVGFIELCGALLMLLATLTRMFFLSEATVYRENALMNANGFALGLALFIFGLFNAVFVGGFFRTAYGLGRPFLLYTVLTLLIIGAGEALHHFPGLEVLNAFGTEQLLLQLTLLLSGGIALVLLTAFSYRRSCRNFEKIDL